jgi:Arginase family
VLDPSFAPGTGTPEAGGLSSRELLRVLRGLTSLNLVSADLIEVAPAYDHAEITSIAAATVVFDIIALLSKRALARSPQSWAASISVRASSAGRVNITSWLPAMGTILHGPNRDDMPGCQVPSGSARSSATAM